MAWALITARALRISGVSGLAVGQLLAASQPCTARVWRISSRGMPAITMICSSVSSGNRCTNICITTVSRSGLLAQLLQVEPHHLLIQEQPYRRGGAEVEAAVGQGASGGGSALLLRRSLSALNACASKR